MYVAILIDAYDAIYDEAYDPYEEIIHINRCKCWKLNDRLVIDFFHPSTFPGYLDEGDRDIELFETLCKMIKEGMVFEKFAWATGKSGQTEHLKPE